MPTALATSIFAEDDLRRERISVPEWGDRELYVRSITAGERGEFEEALRASRKDALTWLALLSVVDRDGHRVFEDSDFAALSAKSATAVLRIVRAASKLNALGGEDVEALEKNSEGGPTGDSGSGSLRNSE